MQERVNIDLGINFIGFTSEYTKMDAATECLAPQCPGDRVPRRRVPSDRVPRALRA